MRLLPLRTYALLARRRARASVVRALSAAVAGLVAGLRALPCALLLALAAASAAHAEAHDIAGARGPFDLSVDLQLGHTAFDYSAWQFGTAVLARLWLLDVGASSRTVVRSLRDSGFGATLDAGMGGYLGPLRLDVLGSIGYVRYVHADPWSDFWGRGTGSHAWLPLAGVRVSVRWVFGSQGPARFTLGMAGGFESDLKTTVRRGSGDDPPSGAEASGVSETDRYGFARATFLLTAGVIIDVPQRASAARPR